MSKGVHTPLPVPLHWADRIKQDQDRDMALGINEPLPVDTPTSWCARMVIVPKANGEQRRTVEFKTLNNASKRQTHHHIFYPLKYRLIPKIST